VSFDIKEKIYKNSLVFQLPFAVINGRRKVVEPAHQFSIASTTKREVDQLIEHKYLLFGEEYAALKCCRE
jgi:hypothetical protein